MHILKVACSNSGSFYLCTLIYIWVQWLCKMNREMSGPRFILVYKFSFFIGSLSGRNFGKGEVLGYYYEYLV